MNYLPKPPSAADSIDPGDEHGRGVRVDTLIDATIEARSIAAGYGRIDVMLDSMADTNEAIPSRAKKDMREIQKAARDNKSWFMELADELAARQIEIAEEQ